MTIDGMFFVTPDEAIDRKTVRVLARLLDLDETGVMSAKIASQLTGTEADRPVLVTASTISVAYASDPYRGAGLEVRRGGRDGNQTNTEKAAERYAVWLPAALEQMRGPGKQTISSVARRVAKKYNMSAETVRQVLSRKLKTQE